MSAAMQAVNANTRSESGKGAARRLRHAGKIPAVAYGKDLPPTPVAVAPKDILSVLKSERGQNTVIEMKLEGAQDLLVMIKDYSYHPVTRHLEHVDFVQVKLDKQVEVSVPLVVTGKAQGVTMGGVLRQIHRWLPIRCLPEQIPLKIETDATRLELGEAIATKDLDLPTGVEARLPPDLTLVTVSAPEKDRSAEEAVVGAAAAAPAAAAGKPAAGGKAAAPAKDDKKKK
jgi:large subunit ribosomal protein L25